MCFYVFFFVCFLSFFPKKCMVLHVPKRFSSGCFTSLQKWEAKRPYKFVICFLFTFRKYGKIK